MNTTQPPIQQTKALLIFRLIALPSIALAAIFFYDLSFPHSKNYNVSITKISKNKGRSGGGYTLYFGGDKKYHANVDSSFLKGIKVGDKAKIGVSSILGAVNDIEISKGENKFLQTKGQDSTFVLLLGTLYSAAILAFTHGRKFHKNIGVVVVNGIISVTACIQLFALSLRLL